MYFKNFQRSKINSLDVLKFIDFLALDKFRISNLFNYLSYDFEHKPHFLVLLLNSSYYPWS